MSGGILIPSCCFEARSASEHTLRAVRPYLRCRLRSNFVMWWKIRRAVLVFTAAMCMVGCSKKSAMPPPPKPQASVAKEAAPVAPTKADDSAKPAVGEPVAKELSTEKPSEAPPKKVEVLPERFAILTPGG